MARQKSSPIEEMIMATSKLPWWVCIVFALLSYLVLHAIASRPAVHITGPGQMGEAVTKSMITTLALFGQMIIPIAFVIGAIISGFNAIRQKKLYDNVLLRSGVGALNEMSWEDFERLVSEHYRRQGFYVSRKGGNGPDGGIDLVLRKKGDTYLVQCKQWKAYKVGVQPVREFYGVMASRGAIGGFFVISGEFTDDARSFVHGLNLELVDGQKLRKMIDNVQQSISPRFENEPRVTNEILPKHTVSSAKILPVAPVCPKCGAGMIQRMARRGDNAGKEFWGCSTYPNCKGIVPITPGSDAGTTNCKVVADQARNDFYQS
jgi:restriction system protein